MLDPLGEWSDFASAECYTVGEAVDAIRHLVKRDPKWTVVIQLPPDDLAELVNWLIPIPDLQRSPVLAMKGAAMLIDESDLVAPPRGMAEEIRTLYRRSRHVGLTLISTTQRPANLSREASAMSTQAIMLKLTEPRDIAYMVDTLGLEAATVTEWQRWTRLHRHGGLWWQRDGSRLQLMENSGNLRPLQTVRQVDAFSEPDEPVPVPPEQES